MIDAAAAQRFVQVPRPVRRQDDNRTFHSAYGTALGDGNLKVGEKLKQERLELLVRSVDLVDQQHRRVRRAYRRQHRPFDQEGLAINVDRLVTGLANRQHLARIVPFVKSGRRVNSLVALQTDQPARQHSRNGFGGLGLADTGRTFKK